MTKWLTLLGVMLLLAVSCNNVPPKEEALRYAADAYSECASAKATVIHTHKETATFRVRCTNVTYIVTCWHFGRDGSFCDNPVYRCRMLGKEATK